MTREDLRILSTALGFTAVILKNEPAEGQAQRAKNIAELIEAFCLATASDAVGDADLDAIDALIDRCRAELSAARKQA